VANLSVKQHRVLTLVRGLHDKYASDPIGWVRDNIDFSGLKYHFLTPHQESIITNLYKHKHLCVSAGGGIGKTAVAAIIDLYHLSTHFYAKVPTTAPSGKLLDDILWSEMAFWLKRCKVQELFTLNQGKLRIRDFPEWYSVARTVPRDGRNLNDTLAGFHSPATLIIVDEASGVPDPVYTALDGALTDENAIILLISNPVSTGGYYYDTISDPEGKGSNYTVLYFDSRDSPLVSKDYEQHIATRYGRNSPMYRAKVMGLPISELETCIITPEDYDTLILQNRERHIGKVTLSGDIAGEGEDPTILCLREGNSIFEWIKYPVNDTTFVVDEILRIHQTRFLTKPFSAIIDAQGIGAGVYDTLKRTNKFPVIGFIGAEKPFNLNMFDIKRSEGYYKLKQILPDLHFPITPPPELKKELVNIRFDYSKGPISMETKKHLKSRIGRSPDYADALMMSCMVDNYSLGYHAIYVPKTTTDVMKKLYTPRREQLTRSKYGKFL